MEIVLCGRNVEVPQHFREHTAEKLARVERYDYKITRMDVQLSHEPNPRRSKNCQRIEITGRGRGPVVRGEGCAADFYCALDQAVARLEARLRRAHDRRRVHHGRRVPISVAQATGALSVGAAAAADDGAVPAAATGAVNGAANGATNGAATTVLDTLLGGLLGRALVGWPDAAPDGAPPDGAPPNGTLPDGTARNGAARHGVLAGVPLARTPLDNDLETAPTDDDLPDDPTAWDPPDADDEQSLPGQIVRRKEHHAVPMSVDDALSQMELVGHDFFLFADAATGRPSVVYRRRGYDYGVIALA